MVLARGLYRVRGVVAAIRRGFCVATVNVARASLLQEDREIPLSAGLAGFGCESSRRMLRHQCVQKSQWWCLSHPDPEEDQTLPAAELRSGRGSPAWAVARSVVGACYCLFTGAMLCKSLLKAEERQLQRWGLAFLSRAASPSQGTRGTVKLTLS